MRRIKILLIALILVLGGVLFSSSYAADYGMPEGMRSLGAQLTRPFEDTDYTNPKYQYLVSGGTTDVRYTIVKLFDSNDKNSDDSLAYTKALYCLRGGIGFGAEDISTAPVVYTEIGEMHADAKNIIENYMNKYKTGNKSGKEINLNTEKEFTVQTGNKKTVNLYNAILWVIDESYLPVDKTNNEGELLYDASEYRAELLDKAGVPKSQQADITDNDIEVIQQLAMWYFTNYDEQLAGIKPTVSQATKFPAQFLSLNGDNNIDDERANNLDRLYQYFIYGAIENADIYTVDQTGARTKTNEENKFDRTNALKVTSHDIEGIYDYYEIGPVKFEGNARNATVQASDIVLYDAKGNVISKEFEIYEQEETPEGEGEKISTGKHVVYKFLDSNGNEVTDLIKGQEYKIRIYKAFEKGANVLPVGLYERYDMSKFTIKVTSSYSLSKATFLSAGNTSQPVVEIEREKVGSSDEITTESYDLALRKFITSINGNVLTGTSSRVPSIDLTKLNTIDNRTNKIITTATYVHKKSILSVETGNKVVYTLRIYNEGEIDGKALKITDYLPAGLELVPASESTINTTYGWVASSDNSKIITTDYLKETTIKAYNPEKRALDEGETGWQKASIGESGLYYADVQVECEVVAQVTGENQELRNVAEITEDDGDDRDSNINNVYDDSVHTPGAEQNGYFPGEQDDDDYEDLVLKSKEFDLSLRKFISKVQRDNQELDLSSREPVIEIKKLKNGTSKTARYMHPKNTLSLKREDIITYTIRVYNEGELDGYALEVKDYLPAGLELVEGQNDIWTLNGNTLTTDVLKNQLLLGYDKNTTSAQDGIKWQKASDDESGLYYYDLAVVCKIKDNVTDGVILKNIAEISIDKSEPTDLPDRDSAPGNVYEDQTHNPGTEVNRYTPGEQDDDDFEKVIVEADEVFDLALRKYIVGVKNSEGNLNRTPDISITPLKQGETTADYNHRKNPVEVKTGNIVTYRFTVYNEGDIDGYVYSVVDYLPQGLTFDAESNTNFIEYKDTYTVDELTGKEYAYKIEGNKLTILPLSANNLFELVAFNGTILESKSIDVQFKVTASESNNDQVLTNVATMTYGAKGANITDRDSDGQEFTVPISEKLLEELPGYKGNQTNKDDLADKTYHYEGQQDDDDFEKIIIKGKPFDLSLRKFITSIKRNGEEVELEDRTPTINTETLINGTFNRNGKLEYTATYEHSKEPLVVKQGDIITYTLRIYNEGERAGYATEITDYIPEGLALILNYNTNFNNEWRLSENYDYDKTLNLVGENGLYKTVEDVKNLKLEDFSNTTSLKEVQLVTGEVSITTNLLDEELINAFDKEKIEVESGWQKADIGEGGLYYKDVQVTCLVIAENTNKDIINNIAEISDDKDESGQGVIDRDSTPDNKKDPYEESQEDDDDYEPVVLRYFDLALRKFITGVETNGKVTNITSRVPNPTMGEDENIVYEHTKAPVEVANNDIVIYTLRVYNEGTLAGYAEEITDDIPEGLIFLPEHDINKQYEWKMFDKDGNATDNLEDAKTIKTEYLSKAKETENRNNLIEAFDSSKELGEENPDYRDIKVAFRVMEPNTSDRIIVNSAQISEDSDYDEDSDPHEWNDGEDDQDNEYIYVKYFDLSLLKWVTQTIVTVDGKTTTTETGFEPNKGLTDTTGIRDNDENEPVAKVEIDKNKLSKTTVKFAYKIRVTNEGEIAGYATEITDFIPEGLEFKAEDNKKYGWIKEGDNKVTTRALETVLLQPGESAELEIIFTWINDKNNLGVKTNIAEITEDYNENNSQDKDSIPNNIKDPYEKEQEDDDDFALVILSIKTGKGMSYAVLITTVFAMLSGGIYLIKKYVLTY